jgi:CRISPR-associated endonuclease Cas2
MLTKQACIIAYDITENRFRTQIADRLVAMGLERIQLSVFAGNVKIKKINDFILWFQKESLIFASTSKDSLIVLNVSLNQLSQMQVFGQKFIDIEMLIDKKQTLIV